MTEENVITKISIKILFQQTENFKRGGGCNFRDVQYQDSSMKNVPVLQSGAPNSLDLK